MAARLPHELCMLILDFLATSGIQWKEFLCITALVCRAWAAHSQRKIFRSFLVPRGNRLEPKRIIKFVYFARHPRIASYVSEIRLAGRMSPSLADMARFLAAVLPHIKHLVIFRTSMSQSCTILSHFPTIKTLEVRYRGFPDPIRTSQLPAHLQLTSFSLSCAKLAWANLFLSRLQDTQSRESLNYLFVKSDPIYANSWTEYLQRVQAFPNLQYLTLCLPLGLENTMKTDFLNDPAASLGDHLHLEVLELRVGQMFKPMSHMRRLLSRSRTHLPRVQEVVITIESPYVTLPNCRQVFQPFEPEAFTDILTDNEAEAFPLVNEATFNELCSSTSGEPLFTLDIAPNLQSLRVDFNGRVDIMIHPSSIWLNMLWEGKGQQIAVSHVQGKQIIHVG